MVLHNETLARMRIRSAYTRTGLVSSMRLCASYLGLDMREALSYVRDLCADLWKGDE